MNILRALPWTGLLIAGLLGILPTALAEDGKGEKDAPFIERTHIAIPRRIGEFKLESAQYDPKNRFSGVSIRFSHPDHPQTLIHLFVYPIGKGNTEKVLDAGMKGFVASMKPAIDAGYYRNFVELDTIEFDLSLPPSGDEAQPSSSTTAESDPREARYAAWNAEMVEASHRVDGRRMRLRYDSKGTRPDEWMPTRSRTYLFHRQLYYFKGRVSELESVSDDVSLDEFGDMAVRELVPAVMAYNIGSCGNSQVFVDPEKTDEDAADQLYKGLLGAQLHQLKSNCHPKPDKTVPTASNAELEVVTIEYAPTDWKSK